MHRTCSRIRWCFIAKAFEALALVVFGALFAVEVDARGAVPASSTAPATTAPQMKSRVVESPPASAPTLVTLHYHTAPAQRVLDDLCRQADVPIRWSLDADDDHARRRVTVHVDRVPFWTALIEVCRQARLQPLQRSPNGDRALWVTRLATTQPAPATAATISTTTTTARTTPTTPTTSVSTRASRAAGASAPVSTRAAEPGPTERDFLGRLPWIDSPARFTKDGLFTVVASEVTVDAEAPAAAGTAPGQRDVTVELVVLSDPSLRVIALGPVAPTALEIRGAEDWLWPLKVRVAVEAQRRRIARLKGTARAAVVVRSERAELQLALLAAGPQVLTIGANRALVQPLEANDGAYTLPVRLTFEERGVSRSLPGGLSEKLWSGMYGFRLVDAHGRPLPPLRTDVSPASSATAMDARLVFSKPGANAARHPLEPGRPEQVVWELPTRVREVEVVYELTDLPVP